MWGYSKLLLLLLFNMDALNRLKVATKTFTLLLTFVIFTLTTLIRIATGAVWEAT